MTTLSQPPYPTRHPVPATAVVGAVLGYLVYLWVVGIGLVILTDGSEPAADALDSGVCAVGFALAGAGALVVALRGSRAALLLQLGLSAVALLYFAAATVQAGFAVAGSRWLLLPLTLLFLTAAAMFLHALGTPRYASGQKSPVR